jgi:hypothetical protein
MPRFEPPLEVSLLDRWVRETYRNKRELENLSSNKRPLAWINPTLLNSWVISGNPAQPLQYRLNNNRKLEFRGSIKGGAYETVAFVIPPIYANLLLDETYTIYVGEPTSLVQASLFCDYTTGEVTVKRIGSTAPVVRMKIKLWPDGPDPLTATYFVDCIIESDLNGWYINNVQAYVYQVSTSGSVVVDLENLTQGWAVLANPVTIDVGEVSSLTSAAPSLVQAGNNQVATNDQIYFYTTSVGADVTGLGVLIEYGPTSVV